MKALEAIVSLAMVRESLLHEETRISRSNQLSQEGQEKIIMLFLWALQKDYEEFAKVKGQAKSAQAKKTD